MATLIKPASKALVSHAYPLGPTVSPEGTAFSVFSSNSTGMEIVFFDHADDPRPARVIQLDPLVDRTSHYWHVFVPGLKAGQLYGYRADGPNHPPGGHRFDRQKVLINPYSKSISVGQHYNRAAASQPGDNAATSMKSVVADLDTFNWEGDRPLKHSFRRTVIYEMHVAGFTRHPDYGVAAANRGTYLGVVEKIPYLQSLGITAIELLPVFRFHPQHAQPVLSNYWGYDPVSSFAPHLPYSTGNVPLVCLDEFRTMVKELHRADIEVILDVVYNHTAETDENGPTLCCRGLENSFYYILDLASIFSRDESGDPMMNAPILWESDSDPVLAGAKLIAEA